MCQRVTHGVSATSIARSGVPSADLTPQDDTASAESRRGGHSAVNQTDAIGQVAGHQLRKIRHREWLLFERHAIAASHGAAAEEDGWREIRSLQAAPQARVLYPPARSRRNRSDAALRVPDGLPIGHGYVTLATLCALAHPRLRQPAWHVGGLPRCSGSPGERFCRRASRFTPHRFWRGLLPPRFRRVAIRRRAPRVGTFAWPCVNAAQRCLVRPDNQEGKGTREQYHVVVGHPHWGKPARRGCGYWLGAVGDVSGHWHR